MEKPSLLNYGEITKPNVVYISPKLQLTDRPSFIDRGEAPCLVPLSHHVKKGGNLAEEQSTLEDLLVSTLCHPQTDNSLTESEYVTEVNLSLALALINETPTENQGDMEDPTSFESVMFRRSKETQWVPVEKIPEGTKAVEVSNVQKEAIDVARTNLGVLRTCRESQSALYRSYFSSWASQSIFIKLDPRFRGFTTIIGLIKLGYALLGVDSRLMKANGEIRRDNFLKNRKALDTGTYMACSGSAGACIRLHRAILAAFGGADGVLEKVITLANFVADVLLSPLESESGRCRVLLAGMAGNGELELIEIMKYGNDDVITDDESFFKGGSGKAYVIDPTEAEMEMNVLAQDVAYVTRQLIRACGDYGTELVPGDRSTGGMLLILCILQSGQVLKWVMKPGVNGYELDSTTRTNALDDVDYLGTGGYGRH